MAYYKKKNFSSEGSFFKFRDTKPHIRKNPLKIEKNNFIKIVLEIFSQSKNT
jgi:hypothetical protein